MEWQVSPEPPDAEREAVLAAVRDLLDAAPTSHPGYESDWRRSGIEDDASADDYAAMPRSRISRGATRA